MNAQLEKIRRRHVKIALSSTTNSMPFMHGNDLTSFDGISKSFTARTASKQKLQKTTGHNSLKDELTEQRLGWKPTLDGCR
jgi:hypothetical protein